MADRRKDRHGYNPGEDEKVYEELKGSQHKIDANKNGKVDAHDFKLLRSKKKKVAEEAEELEELSTDTLRNYRAKAKDDAYDAADVDDDRRLRKRSMGSWDAGKKILKRGDALRKEEVEELDELSKKTMGSYIKKASGAEQPKNVMSPKNVPLTKIAAYQGDSETGHFGSRFNQATYDKAERLRKNRETGIKRATDKLTKEEVEELDETAKIVAHLQKRYGDNIRKSHVRSAANDFGVDASKLARAVRTKLGKNMLDEEQIDEISATTKDAYAQKAGKQLPGLFNKSGKDADSARKYYNRKNTVRKIANEEVELEEKLTAKTPMGTYIKDFKKSDAPQFKGKSQDKRRAMAIAAKLTAERGGKPLRKEEKLADLLGDLTETHRRTMLSVFDKLNEGNQKKFLEACETPEGVESMLDFSISHRGE